MSDNTIIDIREWTCEYYINNETMCKNYLNNSDLLKQIPSLNYSSLNDLHHGQLIRYQGMIQDMYNPEYYFENYTVQNRDTGELSIRSGLYKDSAVCQDNEDIIMNCDNNKNGERQRYVVISIPGLNQWVKLNDTANYHNSNIDNNKSTVAKRNLNINNGNDNCESMDITEPVKKKERLNDNNMTIENSSDRKSNLLLSKEHLLNFPIPIDNGKSCIVNIYDDTISFKLNQVIDIIGFISFNSMFNCHSDNLMEVMMMDDGEMQTHNPPTSLIPRLHAITVKELSLDVNIPNDIEILSKVRSIRSDLHMVLSQLLFGDDLAADYLICHLISSIYTRKDYLCLGNFPINISNIPLDKYETFTKDFYNILSNIVTKSHYFEITLDNLNDSCLIPNKDYDCNRLTSGMLQLSNNTHLIIDETNLNSGQVSSNGRLNYEAINDIVKFQKIKYDFKYYTMEYETDYPVLILSQVKSFIPCLIQVILHFDDKIIDIYQHVCQATNQYLKDENRINNIRYYLQLLRNGNLEIGDDITDIIQEDFVVLRQSHKNINADSLHSLMVFARLMALSYGESSLTLDCWKRTFELEKQRISRLSK